MTEINGKRPHGLSRDEVIFLLDSYPELLELRYLSADSTATDLIVCIDDAIDDAALSDYERTVIDYRFFKQLKLGTIAAYLGKPTYKISRDVQAIVDKIVG